MHAQCPSEAHVHLHPLYIRCSPSTSTATCTSTLYSTSTAINGLPAHHTYTKSIEYYLYTRHNHGIPCLCSCFQISCLWILWAFLWSILTFCSGGQKHFGKFLLLLCRNFFTFHSSSCISVDSLLYAQLIIHKQYGTNASLYMIDTTFISCSYNVEFLLLKLLRA